MRIRLTRSIPVDGLTFGKGAELTLGPDYAMALINRGDAVPVKPEPERATVSAPETAKRRRSKKKAEEQSVILVSPDIAKG